MQAAAQKRAYAAANLRLSDGCHRHGLEDLEAVSGAEQSFARSLGMRHHAEHVAAFVQMPAMFSSDPLGLASGVISPAACAVAEDDAVVALQFPAWLVAEVVAFHVADGNLQNLASREALVKGVSVFSTRTWTGLQMYFRPALRISAPGSRPDSQRIWKPLQMPITSPPASANLRHRLHDGRELGDGPGAQVVAVGKAAGHEDGVAALQVVGLVPEKGHGLCATCSMTS